MKKVIPGVLIVLGAFALGIVMANEFGIGQASNNDADTVVQPSSELAVSDEVPQNTDVSPLKGNAQESDEEDEANDGDKAPFIGVALGMLSDDALADMGLTHGVLIGHVVEDSPADGALEVDDVVTAINGDEVSSPRDIVEVVNDTSPGDVLTFSVMRDGDDVDVDVTVGERDFPDKAVHRVYQAFPHISDRLFNHFGSMMHNMIKAEIKVETDDGVKTYRAAVGTPTNVDVDNGTFDLVLKDESETLSYAINEDTHVAIRNKGDLGGLSEDELALVVDVLNVEGEWAVKLVSQGVHPGRHPRIHDFDHPRLRLHEFDGRRITPFLDRDFHMEIPIPEIRERMRLFITPDGVEGLEDGDFTFEDFLDRLPDDIRRGLEEGMQFSPGELELEIEKEIVTEDSRSL